MASSGPSLVSFLWRTTVVLLAGALLVSACQSDDSSGDTTASDNSSGDTAGSDDSSGDTAAEQLECELKGYPCTLADVPVEILRRSDQLSSDALEMFDGGSSTAEAAEWLEGQPDVVELSHDEVAIRFRVDGGRGTWVVRASALRSTRGGVGVSLSQESLAGRATPLFDVVEPPEPPDDEFRALVLSPMLHQFSPDDEGAAVKEILSEARGYEGRVEYFFNEEPFATDVDPSDFKGWDDYQVIHVATHGFSICEPLSDGPCIGAVASHFFKGAWTTDGDEVIRGSDWAEKVKEIREVGAELGRFEQDDRALVPAEDITVDVVLLTGEFFRNEYPDGLHNTLVFLNGCETTGDRPTNDIVEALRGDTSVVLGWDITVDNVAAYLAAVQFYTDMSEGGYTVGHGLELLGTMRTDRFGAQLIAYNGRSGGDLRIRHVVTALDPASECPFDDGDFYVPIEGTVNDGENDSVPYTVRVDGILPEQADDTVLKIFVMPGYVLEAYIAEDVPLPALESAIDPVPISEGEPLGNDSWLLQGMAPIGRDAVSTLHMWAWVDLPEGGQSSSAPSFLVDDPDIDEAALSGQPSPECSVGDEEDLLTASSFQLLEQRFNFLLQVEETDHTKELGNRTTEERHDLYVLSYEADETQQSTETRDGDEFPIDPLGFGGYVGSLSGDAGSAHALLAMEFFTSTPTKSEIAMSGDYARVLTGSSTGADDPDNLSLAYASTGILFTFTGKPLHVKMVWDCGLEVRLEDIRDLENPRTIFSNIWNPPVTPEAPLTDDHTISREKITRECNQIVPSFDGTLQPDTVYQLVLDFGYFADRYANRGKVWGGQGQVLNETGSYDVHETNTFALILTSEE